MLSDNSIVDKSLIYVNYMIEYPLNLKATNYRKGGANIVIYDNIKNLCSERNISIRTLEVEAKLSNGTIGKWNKPTARPSGESLKRIADALGVTMECLFKS